MSAFLTPFARPARVLAVGALVALVTGPVLGCSPSGDDVCREFSDDLLEVTRDLTSEAGAASFDDLAPDDVDELRRRLGQETYEIEVHRSQLDCDRDVLEDQLCPELAAMKVDGEVAADLLATMTTAYDCED